MTATTFSAILHNITQAYWTTVMGLQIQEIGESNPKIADKHYALYIPKCFSLFYSQRKATGRILTIKHITDKMQ